MSKKLNDRFNDGNSRQRIARELEDAQRIQLKFAPQAIPVVEGINLATRSITASEIGGDYLDVFVSGSQCLVLAIGDVMGKGVPAALLMAMAHVAVRAVLLSEFVSPELVLEKVNKILYDYLQQANSFITMLLAMYNEKTKQLVFARAGHNLPLLFRAAAQECEFLSSKGAYLGGKARQNFEKEAICLEQGDVLILYTDGLIEAVNAQGERYGKHRLIEVLKDSAGMDAASIEEFIRFDLAAFTGSTPQKDDITLIILKMEK